MTGIHDARHGDDMIKVMNALFAIALFLVVASTSAGGERSLSFSPYVDSKGAISLPSDFRSTWVHLGTWVVTSTAATGPGRDNTGPGTGIHDVYTQEKWLKDYKKRGKWPDGTVLVMEVRAMQWDDLPTGHVIVEGEPIKWMIMVKDAKGRFSGNSNWGDGWGWALFKSANPKSNVSANYKNDCLSCHEVAKETDWVFTQGYPTLR